MINTELFYQQHDELIEMATAISAECDSDANVVEKADDIRRSINRMMGKLGVHLAIEDDYLYPRLKSHPDPLVRETTARFEREMFGLKPAFRTFKEKWTSDEIRLDPHGFRSEITGLFAALGHRVECENIQLYPYLGDL